MDVDAKPAVPLPTSGADAEPEERLWKHRNGRWYILFGPRLKQQLSTGTKDRAQAERELAAFRLGRAAGGVSGQTVREILDGYEREKLATVRSPGGIKYSVAPLRERLGALTPVQLLRPVIRAYATARAQPPSPEAIARARELKRRAPKPVGAGTILKEVGTLRAALEWARESGLITAYPPISNPVPTPPPRERWLTREEARALFAECHEPHLRGFVLLGLMTAARSGAILELIWPRVLWDHNLIDYGRGHGNKRRAVVPMNGELREFLEDVLHPLACSDRVIERHGKPVTDIKNGFAAACERAGIEGATPNTLRHTSATWMAMAAVPMRDIARMLGDSEATTERVYAKYHPDYLKTASGALVMNPNALEARRPTPEAALESVLKERQISQKERRQKAALVRP
jgi:integrase